MSIVPLGLNRVSVPLQTNRAYNSLQSAQSLLSRYENQIMTQRQYQYGSDSPYNASTTLGVQSQIERKSQNASNLKTTLTFLTATDSTLSRFNSMTDDARSMALDAINTTTDQTQRGVLAQNVKQTVQQIFDFGNYSFEGRYVFSGSTTSVMPFEWGSDSYTVTYRGTESNVYSWSDTNLLSQSNMNGVDVFGAISDPVRGKADVDPSISSMTLLSDLNGGLGVDKGSIRLTYSVDNKLINYDLDLSGCVTLGDVEQAFENLNSPYFSINVDLTRDNLVLSLPSETQGTLVVSEIGKGSVARQLGIPTGTEFSAQKNLEGRDVNPALTTTTPLTDILGSNANVSLRFAGVNNDLVLKAIHNGESFTDADGTVWPLNDVSVYLQADTTITPGNEYVEYDPETQQMLIRIHPDNTTANNVIKAVDRAVQAGTIPPFEATLSSMDQTRSDLAGTGTISLLPGASVYAGTTSGGSGTDFDLSGIQIVNGNATYDISFENCKTVGDMLAELNDPRYGLQATINSKQNGFDIRSRVSGADFCIGENGGATASQLGIRTTDLDTRLKDLDFGRGVTDYEGPGTMAKASYTGVDANSALLLTARNEGSDWNGYTLQFIETSDPDGKVTVAMDEENKTITVGIKGGTTTACEIVEAFDTQPGPKQYFDLVVDTTSGPNTGQGVVNTGFIKTSGGVDGGVDFTITRNDGTALAIDIHGAVTMGDVLKIINEHPDNADGLLVASLSKTGNGIELTDKSFGDSVTRVDRSLLSTTAIELGLVNQGEEYRTETTSGTTAVATIDFGTPDSLLLVTAKQGGTYANDVKIEFVEGTPPSFTWDAASKTMQFSIEPGVTTAQDVIDLFQAQASDTVRSMFDIRNGMYPDGTSSDGSGAVTVQSGTMTGGEDGVLTGNDPNPQETKSLFNALIRLQVAMENNDEREIERATQLLDESVQRMTDARTTIGVMQNSLDNVQARLSEEYVQHEETLNQTLRIDYADASLSYMAQQLSYQASMQMTSALFQMSLLNYI